MSHIPRDFKRSLGELKTFPHPVYNGHMCNAQKSHSNAHSSLEGCGRLAGDNIPGNGPLSISRPGGALERHLKIRNPHPPLFFHSSRSKLEQGVPNRSKPFTEKKDCLFFLNHASTPLVPGVKYAFKIEIQTVKSAAAFNSTQLFATLCNTPRGDTCGICVSSGSNLSRHRGVCGPNQGNQAEIRPPQTENSTSNAIINMRRPGNSLASIVNRIS
jgi:hypothetical protein